MNKNGEDLAVTQVALKLEKEIGIRVWEAWKHKSSAQSLFSDSFLHQQLGVHCMQISAASAGDRVANKMEKNPVLMEIAF